jgi:hypothetical protein
MTMFHTIRTRINATTVVAVLALVFAMTGGAYAAKKYLITSTKQISPSVLKSLQGKAGPAGANGAQGAAGSAGPQGAAGVAGAKGGDGKEGSPGKEGKKGVEGEPGPEGPPGPTCLKGECLLPEGATETGNWSFTGRKGSEFVFMSISFPLRLTSAPTFHYVTREEQENKTAVAEGCPSTGSSGFTEPKADAGDFCVYEGTNLHNAEPPEIEGGGDATSGETLFFLLKFKEATEEEAYDTGTWAVAR